MELEEQQKLFMELQAQEGALSGTLAYIADGAAKAEELSSEINRKTLMLLLPEAVSKAESFIGHTVQIGNPEETTSIVLEVSGVKYLHDAIRLMGKGIAYGWRNCVAGVAVSIAILYADLETRLPSIKIADGFTLKHLLAQIEDARGKAHEKTRRIVDDRYDELCKEVRDIFDSGFTAPAKQPDFAYRTSFSSDTLGKFFGPDGKGITEEALNAIKAGWGMPTGESNEALQSTAEGK